MKVNWFKRWLRCMGSHDYQRDWVLLTATNGEVRIRYTGRLVCIRCGKRCRPSS